MSKIKDIFKTLFFAAVISSCSTFAFNYPHYTLDMENQYLRAVNPTDDLPLTVCNKSPAGYSCVVMNIEIFYQMKAAYEKQHNRIVSLERYILTNGLPLP